MRDERRFGLETRVAALVVRWKSWRIYPVMCLCQLGAVDEVLLVRIPNRGRVFGERRARPLQQVVWTGGGVHRLRLRQMKALILLALPWEECV